MLVLSGVLLPFSGHALGATPLHRNSIGGLEPRNIRAPEQGALEALQIANRSFGAPVSTGRPVSKDNESIGCCGTTHLTHAGQNMYITCILPSVSLKAISIVNLFVTGTRACA
jgi:hypothetical protein